MPERRTVCVWNGTEEVMVSGTATGGMDVDVTSITTGTVTSVSGTKSSSGDNELIGAPASGNRIVIVAFTIQNESATATTMILKDGSTAFARCLGQNQGDGLARVYAADRRKKLSDATALNLNLSGANSCGYSVDYYTEAV